MSAKSKTTGYKWQFKLRFRRNAFGWRSQPAVKRVKEAVSEIRRVARTDKVLAAEGAVSFLEKVSPALSHVDSSSGAIGTAVHNAIEALVVIIASAQVDRKTREGWLYRLFEAHAEDEIPYIEQLAEYWGDLCVTPNLASKWADDLIGITRRVLHPDRTGEFFHGTSACLSALYTAGRYEEIIDLVEGRQIWGYQQWKVKALAAQGQIDEAIRFAESCRSPWASDYQIDILCEEILLSSGKIEDAYERYGLTANHSGTYLAWLRAVARKYPHKRPAEILEHLIALTPGDEGKWFAAAKSIECFERALELARSSACSPQTLTRAARDFCESRPIFAMESGFAALKWFIAGYGYDVTASDVLGAMSFTMKAAENANLAQSMRDRLHILVGEDARDESYVKRLVRRQLELDMLDSGLQAS